MTEEGITPPGEPYPWACHAPGTSICPRLITPSRSTVSNVASPTSGKKSHCPFNVIRSRISGLDRAVPSAAPMQYGVQTTQASDSPNWKLTDLVLGKWWGFMVPFSRLLVVRLSNLH